MKQMLIRVLKVIASDIRQAAVPAILLLLVGGSAGLLLLSHRALASAIQIANIPTPLWATIALVLLCCVYVYLRPAKRQPSSSSPSKYQTKYFTIGKYKWETKIYKDGFFEVEKYPYCVMHDLKFIFGSNGKYCPGTEKELCNNRLSNYDEFQVYETAKSRIENLIRNKKF